MGFIGVTTGGSSIMRVYPRWAEILGLPARTLTGHDLPLDASPEWYRTAVRTIRDDPSCWGALVTTHKIAVYESASRLFDHLDDYAGKFGEVSCISKRAGTLIGHAKDPISAALALAEFLAADHFTCTGGEAVCFGTGGAGCAITYCLAERADRPVRITCLDTSTRRLEHARRVHQAGGFPRDLFRYVVPDGAEHVRQLMLTVPPESLIVNATGMGKDRPGSPLPARCEFPRNAIAWDLNYRGTLEFLLQAGGQQARRNVTAVDGWRYFIHGWTQVIAEVFRITLDRSAVETLARAAAELR